MNNNIVFDNDNNSDSNAELLKNNTPNTVNYNELYNTNNYQNMVNGINDSISNNNQNMVNNNIANNIANTQSEINNQENNTKKKKGMDSLLFVFLLFTIILGIIIFLFPLLSKYLLV